MAITFRPAQRERTGVIVGLAGPSSSGKTYSALRLANGLADGRPIFMIDTESRRGLHYADDFTFRHGDLTAPFRPEAYLEALQAARQAGAGVIIVDSTSHEQEGPGGILEWHEEELDRMSKGDGSKRDKLTFAAWIKPKRAHNLFVNTVLQFGDVHLIFCFRAKEKLKLVKTAEGKIEPVPQGWRPICADRFEYEMTALLMLPPGSQGRPDLSLEATKIQEQHRAIFRDGAQIDEEMGRQLAEWAAGGSDASAELLASARAEAAKGRAAFEAFWRNLRPSARRALKPHGPELGQLADAADGKPTDQPSGATEGTSAATTEDVVATAATENGQGRSAGAQDARQMAGEPQTAAGGEMLTGGHDAQPDEASEVPGGNDWEADLVREAYQADREGRIQPWMQANLKRLAEMRPTKRAEIDQIADRAAKRARKA